MTMMNRRPLTARLLLTLLLAATLGACSHKSNDEAIALVDQVYKAKDYNRLMALADSLQDEGDLLPSTADYWRGYACDRMKRKQEAATYWQRSIDEAAKSESDEDTENYVKSASRLANQLCVAGDYKGTLQVAEPVVARLQQLGRDNTSDYINLLIYIGLSQVSTGQSEEQIHQGFLLACEKHRQNIDSNHSDDAYKDAIAGLVNIAYYCVVAKKYEEALYYTRSFGELLIEYEQRPGVDASYIDRQVGRFTIYKSLAQDRLGRKADAEATYKAFLETNFSRSPEGKAMAANYQAGIVADEAEEATESAE